MTAGEALAAAQCFPFCTLDERLGSGALVVIAPHPDDESLACGGLIAEACARGRFARVVIMSDGVGSHPASRTYPKSRLRDLREAEARQAASELGLDPRNVLFLRLPDQFVPSQGPAAERAVLEIVECVDELQARALFVTWRHDPHCDHQAAYRIARSVQQRRPATKLYECSVWGSALPAATPVQSVSAGFPIRIDRQRAAKRRAIAAHRSQTTDLIDDDPTGFRLTGADLARFDLPYETFFESDT